MKRIIALLLTFTILFIALPVSSFAENLGANATTEDIERVMQKISEATDKIQELKDAGTAAAVSSSFADFMKVAGYVGTTLSVINGSITFMKMIGVIEDPIKSGINNILDQLRTVNDVMAEVDTKLDSMASSMTAMQASMEFLNRANKAQTFRNSWNTFQYNYMENGLDSLMAEYQGMLINGIREWCLNEETNTSINVFK